MQFAKQRQHGQYKATQEIRLVGGKPPPKAESIWPESSDNP